MFVFGKLKIFALYHINGFNITVMVDWALTVSHSSC